MSGRTKDNYFENEHNWDLSLKHKPIIIELAQYFIYSGLPKTGKGKTSKQVSTFRPYRF